MGRMSHACLEECSARRTTRARLRVVEPRAGMRVTAAGPRRDDHIVVRYMDT